VFECGLLALTQPHNHSATRFIALSMIRRSKSIQKSTIQEVCKVATVVMETRQLVLSQFKKKLFILVNGELNKLISMPKIISECGLVKLCDINCSSPVF